jgi:mercuric ion transport protein
MMKNKTSLRFGILGTVVSLLVCFSPMVITVLGLLGLASWFVWIDSVFYVVLLLSIGLILFGFYRMWRYQEEGTPETITTSRETTT